MKISLEYDTVTKEMKAKKGDEEMIDEMDIRFSPSHEKGKYYFDMTARKYDEENKCVHMYTLYANEQGELVEKDKQTKQYVFTSAEINPTLKEKFEKYLRGF